MIQSKFSIKDLESLSGIKAHTIRIWEKRYKVLDPKRTNTNIRYYDLEDLKQLLNISFLIEHKYKISKIAKLSLSEIQDIITDLSHTDTSYQAVLNELKIAMLNFDENVFYEIHQNYTQELGFEKLCEKIYLPFLKLIGILWHTETISIAHEHFINHFIHKKILIETEKINTLKKESNQRDLSKSKQQYILFLPDNELHDLGLLYLNYLLCKKGKNVIYLGSSIMSKELHKAVKKDLKNILITYFTVKPENEELNDFFKEFNTEIQQKYHNTKLIVIAPSKIQYVDLEILTDHQRIYSNTSQALEYLNSL